VTRTLGECQEVSINEKLRSARTRAKDCLISQHQMQAQRNNHNIEKQQSKINHLKNAIDLS
jgi:hypothetical protein